MDEKEKEKRRLAKLRDKYRSTVCVGCRDNRYNYQQDGDVRNAPTSGDGCWSLDSIRRGVCPVKRR